MTLRGAVGLAAGAAIVSSMALAPLTALAARSSSSLASSSSGSRLEAKRTRTQTPEERLSFKGDAGYSVASDYAQEEDPRAYMHKFGVNGTVAYADEGSKIQSWYAGAGLGVMYTSLDTEIDKTYDPFQITDIDLNLGRTFDLGRWISGAHTLDVIASNAVPMSEESRYEGYRSIPAADVSLTSAFLRGRFAITQSIGVAYVVNSNRFSPVTFETNPDLSGTYTAALSVRVIRGLKLSGGASVKSQNYLDGSRTLGWNNFQSISYSLGAFSLALKHVNGHHVLDRSVDLWFIDDYRRLITVSASVRF